MNRRSVLAGAGGVFGAGLAGCLSPNDPAPEPELLWVELENHRRDVGYEFAVRIRDGEETVFDATRELGAAESGSAATVIEEPVQEPGSYTVGVEAAGHSATVDTGPTVTADERCLALTFSLGANTLHAEHTAYSNCE